MLRLKVVAVFFLFWTQAAYSEDLAIMVFIQNSEEGDRFYDSHLKIFSFKRPHALTNDYHITLGYVRNVEDEDVENFKDHFRYFLKNRINFEIDEIGLLVRTSSTYRFFNINSPEFKDKDFPQGRRFIVAVSYKNDVLKKLNQSLYKKLLTYRNGKYKLEDITAPDNFTPHLTLEEADELPHSELPEILEGLNDSLKGLSLKLTRIVVN